MQELKRSNTWKAAKAIHPNRVGFEKLYNCLRAVREKGAIARITISLSVYPARQLILTYQASLEWSSTAPRQHKQIPSRTEHIEITFRLAANGRCVYYGSIDEEGIFLPASPLLSEDTPVKRMIWEVLERLRDDPETQIKELGKERGTCILCNRELSDPVSIKLGVGPICAKKFDFSLSTEPPITPLDIEALMKGLD